MVRGSMALVFIAFVAMATAIGVLPFAVLGLYLMAGIVTFAAYALDKAAARQGRWRTPETTLHLLALLGGWPGGLVAQGVLRHKSIKRPFQVMFWGTVVLNGGGLAWLLSPAAAGVRHFLQGLTG